MKRIILLLIAIVLSNCEISPRKVKAESIENGLNYVYHYSGGMKYVIILSKGAAYGGNSYSTSVINITKDSLECEYYRKINR